jgi:hypothetical protein
MMFDIRSSYTHSHSLTCSLTHSLSLSHTHTLSHVHNLSRSHWDRTHWYEAQHLIERGTNSVILAAEEYLSSFSTDEASRPGATSPDQAGLEPQPEVLVSGVEHFSGEFQSMVQSIGRAGLLPANTTTEPNQSV